MINELDRHTTLLTPNRRLSATLLKKYNQAQIEAGKTCWESVAILPFTSWIQRLWLDYSASHIGTAIPYLLSPQQEIILWEEILQQFPANETLLQLSETAELAKSAWDILKQWRVDLSHPMLATTDDSNTFLSWAAYFQNKCIKNHWIDTHSLIPILCEKILQNLIHLPKRIIAAGFTELSPLQKYLFDCCKRMGTHVAYDLNNSSSSPALTQRISLADEETEIRTMARWAKSLTEHDSTLKIGCVVPNLEKKRDTVSAIFSEVFCEGELFSLDCTTQPFNITAGKSLSTYPIIHAALQLLALNNPSLTFKDINHLLLTPFVGDAENEQIKRAQFDVYLRKANIINYSLQKLMNSSEKLNLYNHSPRLAKRLDKFLTLLNQQPAYLPMQTWALIFTESLALLGWPGERSINSQEYQIVQRWLELFDEYRTLDTLLSNINYQKALHYLKRLTSNVVFQPQGTDASIQILGVLEATALPFDHTWVMGFDDSAWPPAAKPNPFIPHRLQANLKMPHSSAAHEYEYSKRLTEQLIESTQHIIFSHAKNNADYELRTSPLIIGLTEINAEQLGLSSFISLSEICRQSQLIETLQDDQAPEVTAVNNRGGASIFKLQAACPFKAFAEIRLNAKPLECTTLGLRPQDRGKIVHKALELIWSEIKTSEKLKSYSDNELKHLLTISITKAVQVITQIDYQHSRYLSLEIKRLQLLLWNWLQVEKTRSPFNVLSQEEERSVNIANLPIQLRIDRIDELEDGSHLIIDYKTGKNNPIKYWFGDRLEEPQLPLYCISATSSVKSIAFAEIHADSLTLKGISKQNIASDAIKPLLDTNYSEGRSWEQQVAYWHSTLEKLGGEFAKGHAEVNPKNSMETCNYCQLKSLCRLTDHQHTVTAAKKEMSS